MNVKKTVIFLLIIATQAYSQTIKILKEPSTLEDFNHQIPGCPENSTCDATMGHHLKQWQNLLKEIKEKELDEIKKAKELEAFRQNLGIPLLFYTSKKSQQGFKPVLFDSQCKHHKNKNQDLNVLKGEAFIQQLKSDKAILKKDQTLFEIPYSEIFKPQVVDVYDGVKWKRFYLALNDQPSYFEAGSMIILREDEDVFYQLKITEDYDWSVVPLNLPLISKLDQLKETIPCPKDLKKNDDLFQIHFCRKIWDTGLKSHVVVRMSEGCL